MRYTITVRTSVTEYEGNAYVGKTWTDIMSWNNVDDDIVEWFAGSCKAAVGWYVNRPEITTGTRFEIGYSTRIVDEDGNEHPGSVEGVILDNLSYRDVRGFQRFALLQLSELISVFESKEDEGPGLPDPKTRSHWLAKLRLLWGVITA
jgi:hypothetical protein